MEWKLDNPTDRVVRLLQFTDSHLGEVPHSDLLGLDTDESLQSVVALAGKEHSDADVLLLTGDLTDKGSLDAVDRVQSSMQVLDKPTFWLPGNHDVGVEMRDAVGSLVTQIALGSWRVIMLNSAVEGMSGGHFSDSELMFLSSALASAPEPNILLAMHHHPVPCGTAWLDEQVIDNANELFEITHQHPAVKAMLWGHIHQEYVGTYQGKLMLGSPSTCVQFYPGSDGFRADTRGPGYRWLNLYPDGSIETGVSRVSVQSSRIDFNAKGY